MSTTAPPSQARRARRGAPSGPTPFWLRLNSFFAFPFQREPLTYGLLLGEWPLIVTNGICLLLSTFILAMKLLPRAKKEAVADALDPTT